MCPLLIFLLLRVSILNLVKSKIIAQSKNYLLKNTFSNFIWSPLIRSPFSKPMHEQPHLGQAGNYYPSSNQGSELSLHPRDIGLL